MSELNFSLHHVSVLVADTRTALNFYHDILGMEIEPNRPQLRYAGAWLKVGDGQIHLIEMPNPDPVTGRPAHGGDDRHTALSVSDLAAVQSRLDTAGVPYKVSQSGRQALFCRDPDGNALELIQAT